MVVVAQLCSARLACVANAPVNSRTLRRSSRISSRRIAPKAEESKDEAAPPESAPAPEAPAAEAPAEEAPAVGAPAETQITKGSREDDELWFATSRSLAYLDGTLAGDFGFDPLGLSDPEGAGALMSPGWLAYAEVIHCRFAMLGAAGAITPEILGKLGVIPPETAVPWFQSGVIPPLGTFDYWCDPYTLFSVELTLMGFAEFRRLQDYKNPGSMGKQWFLGMEKIFEGSGDPKYPGGPWFNMMSLGQTEEAMNDLKLKEVKNGRLAMISCLGFAIQSAVTGKGPLENLFDHLANPTGANFLTNLTDIGGAF